MPNEALIQYIMKLQSDMKKQLIDIDNRLAAIGKALDKIKMTTHDDTTE